MLPSTPHTAAAFYQKSFEKQQPLIHESIFKAIDKILAGEEEIKQTVGQKIASKHGKVFKGNSSDLYDQKIVQDTEFQQFLKDINYTHILKHNKELGNIVYIDPTQEESRKGVLQALEKLDPISPGSLAFNDYTSNRVEFDNAFAEGITPFLGLLKCKAKITNYSLDLLEELQEEAQHCADYHEKMLKIVSVEEVLTDEIRKNLELAYTISEDTSSQKQVLENNITGAKQKKRKLKNEINNLLNGKPILYWTDRWCIEKKSLWDWWRGHRCYYPGTPEVKEWRQILRDGTSLDRIVRYGGNILELEFTSKCFYDCAGTVEVFIAAKDDPSTAVLIAAKNAEIEALKPLISQYRQSLDNLSRAACNHLKDKISSRLRFFKQQTDQLGKAIELRQKVDNLYGTHAKKIEIFTRIADKLASEKPIVEDLRKSYKEFLTLQLNEIKELHEILQDHITMCPMLDPVQLMCNGNETHGYSYERRVIAQHLERKKNCPTCRQVTNKFIPVGSLQLEASKIIDGIYNDTLYAEKLLESIQDSLNNS